MFFSKKNNKKKKKKKKRANVDLGFDKSVLLLHSAASDLGLHCFIKPFCYNTSNKYGAVQY